MTDPSRQPPNLDQETPTDADADLTGMIAGGFSEQYEDALNDGERLTVLAKTGDNAAYVRLWVGNERHVVQFEVFVRGVPGDALDGALGPAVDFLDGVLSVLFEEDRDASLPLDFVGHPYDDTIVFARQQSRDLLAEAEAEKWLNAEEV